MNKAKYSFVDSAEVEWEKSDTEGVKIKRLATANDQVMALYWFSPNVVFPDHVHQGPEFIYMLEGSAIVGGKWIHAGWSSGAETGSIDKQFTSGDSGCIFLCTYTQGSTYL